MKPKFITFTGVDDRTDFTRLKEIQIKYPVEWGVLFSGKNMDARYPSEQTITELLNVSSQVSAHLCGKAAKENEEFPMDKSILKRFRRVQINGFNIDRRYASSIESLYGVEVILQLRKKQELADDFCFLFDTSGGKGILPKNIPILKPTGKMVGYAGGMSPETVLDYLSRIEGVENYWIDMETGVRTNGWFDLDKVELVCQKVYGR